MTTPLNTGTGSRKAAPFFTGMLNGEKVRFFHSPDDGPRFPWACLDDIIVAAKMNRQSRRHAHLVLRDTKTLPSEIVSTADGLARIASNTAANSFAGALVHLCAAPSDFESQMGHLQLVAVNTMLPGMNDADRITYMLAARRAEEMEFGPATQMGVLQ